MDSTPAVQQEETLTAPASLLEAGTSDSNVDQSGTEDDFDADFDDFGDFDEAPVSATTTKSLDNAPSEQSASIVVDPLTTMATTLSKYVDMPKEISKNIDVNVPPHIKKEHESICKLLESGGKSLDVSLSAEYAQLRLQAEMLFPVDIPNKDVSITADVLIEGANSDMPLPPKGLNTRLMKAAATGAGKITTAWSLEQISRVLAKSIPADARPVDDEESVRNRTFSGSVIGTRENAFSAGSETDMFGLPVSDAKFGANDSISKSDLNFLAGLQGKGPATPSATDKDLDLMFDTTPKNAKANEADLVSLGGLPPNRVKDFIEALPNLTYMLK